MYIKKKKITFQFEYTLQLFYFKISLKLFSNYYFSISCKIHIIQCNFKTQNYYIFNLSAQS